MHYCADILIRFEIVNVRFHAGIKFLISKVKQKSILLMNNLIITINMQWLSKFISD